MRPPLPHNRTGSARPRRGMSLAEVLISLSISVTLLVAVSAAYNASAAAVEMNDRFFRTSQAARVTLNQMMTEIRRCEAAEVGTNYIKIMRPVEDLKNGEVYRKFAYDAAGKRITVQIFKTGDVGGPVYTLASNVQAATFGPAEQRQLSNQAWVVMRVPVTVTVKVGTNEVSLNGSAGPRRNQKS